jgi:hypothetical protein
VDWFTPLSCLMSAKQTVQAPVVEGTTDSYGMLWSLVAERVCALGRPSVLAFSLTKDAVVFWSVLASASAAPLSRWRRCQESERCIKRQRPGLSVGINPLDSGKSWNLECDLCVWSYFLVLVHCQSVCKRDVSPMAVFVPNVEGRWIRFCLPEMCIGSIECCHCQR